jgi:hypothetical protein
MWQARLRPVFASGPRVVRKSLQFSPVSARFLALSSKPEGGKGSVPDEESPVPKIDTTPTQASAESKPPSGVVSKFKHMFKKYGCDLLSHVRHETVLVHVASCGLVDLWRRYVALMLYTGMYAAQLGVSYLVFVEVGSSSWLAKGWQRKLGCFVTVLSIVTSDCEHGIRAARLDARGSTWQASSVGLALGHPSHVARLANQRVVSVGDD